MYTTPPTHALKVFSVGLHLRMIGRPEVRDSLLEGDGFEPSVPVKPWNAEHAAGRITRPLRANGIPYQGIQCSGAVERISDQRLQRPDLDDFPAGAGTSRPCSQRRECEHRTRKQC